MPVNFRANQTQQFKSRYYFAVKIVNQHANKHLKTASRLTPYGLLTAEMYKHFEDCLSSNRLKEAAPFYDALRRRFAQSTRAEFRCIRRHVKALVLLERCLSMSLATELPLYCRPKQRTVRLIPACSLTTWRDQGFFKPIQNIAKPVRLLRPELSDFR